MSGGASASFVYDGDGKRVKATVNGVTTVYIGDYYEQTGAGVTQYYYAGSQRIALRRSGYASDNGLFYLLADHLGSTAVTANASGTKTGELRYKAWGETRYTWGTTLTAYKFTGQRLDDSTGLYYYGARYYDAALGRFISADPIVPEPGNPSHGDSLRSQAPSTNRAAHARITGVRHSCIREFIRGRPPPPPRPGTRSLSPVAIRHRTGWPTGQGTGSRR